MKKIIVLLILCFPVFLFSQITDDFEDGNLDGWTENSPGHWAASDIDPISGTYSLKHNLDGVEDISYITHSMSGISPGDNETVWMFNLKNGNWDPSGANFFGVFLFSDNEDLTSSLNGYAVGINFSGTGDLLSLWRVTGGSFSNIIESSFDWQAAETIGIKVTRSTLGEWTLEYDSDGGFDNLILGGTGTDITHTNALYTGAYFEYTSTRAGEFWLDDFSITNAPDTDPPFILNINTISENTILVNFNEDLDQTSAENLLNYNVNGGIGNPNSATLNFSDNKQVELVFPINFTSGTTYTLTVNNVEDLAGNPNSNEQENFMYIAPEPINDDFEDGDISNWQQSDPNRWEASSENPINGIFSLFHSFDNPADGHDQISIPATSFNINTQTTVWRFQVRYEWDPSSSNNWSCFLFADENASEMHPGGTANGYAIGVNYSGSGDTLKLWKVTNGSGSELLNTGINWQEDIGTSTAVGLEIKRTISGEWTVYTDNNGGFDNLLQSGSNVTDNEFTTADHLGFYYEYSSTKDTLLWIDDVYMGEEIPDEDAPYITETEAVTSNTILLHFNEFLDETSAEVLLNYEVSNGIGNPAIAILNPSNNKEVELIFTGTFVDNLDYTLIVNNVEDLAGNPCVNETSNFSYLHIAVTGAVPVSTTEIDVFYNKDVDITSAEILTNYTVNNGIGNPVSAATDTEDHSIVHLSFSEEFVLEQQYTINIQNIEDEYGNNIESVNINFSYYIVQPYDIVINEIMCDVNPVPQALPVHEYLEIYNNSPYIVNFTDWTLKIGDNIERPFPSINLPPDEYAIICEDDAEQEFTNFGITIPILNPSELTVSGKRLLIKNSEGNIIEDLTYSDDWYDNDAHDDGGWSLERIDPLNFCGEDDNWTASEDVTGGTPGRTNNVYAVNPDLSAPAILSIEYISSKQVNIHFSENINTLLAKDTINYLLNSSVYPNSVSISSETSSIVILHFTNNFNIGTNTINIQNIEDNCSNIMSEFNSSFEYQLIKVISADVVSENQMKIYFSENTDILTAQNSINYFVDGGIGNPSVAIISNIDSTVINLLFDNTFTLEQTYILTVANIQDINQNEMSPANIEFVYYIPKPFDIVFTEVMADINPEPVGLPVERYVEIYNTSEFTINLTDWLFVAEGQSEREFPYIKIDPGVFVILCEEEAEQSFLQYGKVAPILSSSDITSSGRNIKLLTAQGSIINEISYTNEWYDDEEYDDGGWSLEIIDPYNFCGENNNWTVSIDGSGGTPGRTNSVNAVNADNTAPEILDVQIVSSNYILLEFDENISYESGGNINNFVISNNIGNPLLSNTDESDRKLVHLEFSDQFQNQETYSLIIENIQDNCENTIQTTGFDFKYERIFPENVFVEDENSLKIIFSESVDFESGTNILNYSCNNNLGNPVYAFRETADTSVVHIQFADAFPNGEEIILTIQNVQDVNGNEMIPTEFNFSYYLPVQNDLILNEVLFNPFKDGSDFVEIYNRSEYSIDLKNLRLAKRDNNDSIVSLSALSNVSLLMLPETYLAFTLNKDSVLRDYMSQNQENIFEIDQMPSYSDDEGTVILIHKNDSIIDEFSYNEDMHFALLDDVEGVSLERVSFEKQTQDITNWHSASEYVGFATPAYQNSQYAEAGDVGNDPVNIDPYVFSPDNDGYDDYANINYQFQDHGNTATVIIFDSKGRPVEELANNMTLSTQGTIVWDGLYKDNRIAPAGTYLVYFKVFNLNGNVKVYKKTVVLAKKI